MPSSNWTVNALTWASVGAGAKKWYAQNPHPSMMLEYTLASSAPAESAVGIKILPLQVVKIEAQAGDNVYMRLSGAEIVRSASVVVPAVEAP